VEGQKIQTNQMTQLWEWMTTHTGVDEPGNITDSRNIPEQNTGVEKNTYDSTEPIPEEENKPDKYLTIGCINITSEINTCNRESTENEEVEVIVNDIYDQDQKVMYNLHLHSRNNNQ